MSNRRWIGGYETEPFYEEEEWKAPAPVTVRRKVTGVTVGKPEEKTFRGWLKENYGRLQLLKEIAKDPRWIATQAEDRELLYEVYRDEMWHTIAKAADKEEESLPEFLHRAAEGLQYYVGSFSELQSVVVWINASIVATSLINDPRIRW